MPSSASLIPNFLHSLLFSVWRWGNKSVGRNNDGGDGNGDYNNTRNSPKSDVPTTLLMLLTPNF